MLEKKQINTDYRWFKIVGIVILAIAGISFIEESFNSALSLEQKVNVFYLAIACAIAGVGAIFLSSLMAAVAYSINNKRRKVETIQMVEAFIYKIKNGDKELTDCIGTYAPDYTYAMNFLKDGQKKKILQILQIIQIKTEGTSYADIVLNLTKDIQRFF